MSKRLLLFFFVGIHCLEAFPSNGEGIGGGDEVEARIENAKADLIRGLSWLRMELSLESVCAPEHCVGMTASPSCKTLARLTRSQVTQCRQHVVSMARPALAWLSSPEAKLVLSSEPMTLTTPNSSRKVTASTKMGTSGAIQFHRDSIRGLSSGELVALLAHEVGHKLPDAVPDEGRKGHFLSGRALLDAAGAAIAVYAERYQMPRQSPPQLPRELAAGSVCGTLRDFSSLFLVGLRIDTENEPLPETSVTIGGLESESSRYAVALKALQRRSARSRWIDDMFLRLVERNPTPDERSLLLAELQSGTPRDVVIAAILGNSDEARPGWEDDRIFLENVYGKLAGRAPTASEFTHWLARLKASQARSPVLVQWLEQSVASRELELKRWYRSYLNREPSDSERVPQLARLGAGVGWESVQASILSSNEYLMLQGKRWQNCAEARLVGKR